MTKISPKGTKKIIESNVIISKSTGLEVDRKRSLAAKKAAVTRKTNQEQASQRTALRFHHKVVAAGAIAGVIVLTIIGIHAQLDTYAATSTSKSAQGLQNGTGLCMDNDHGIKKNGNKIQLWKCNATASQTWTIGSDGRVKNSNGYCLDTPGTKPKAGDKATLRECGGGNEMKWSYTGNTLVNKAVKLCLNGTSSGTALTLQKCSGSKGQKWTSKYITIKSTTSSSSSSSSKSTSSSSSSSKSTTSSGSSKSSLSAKQQLAKQIMDSGKVSFITVSGVSAAARKKIFTDIASGKTSGNSLPCGLNIRVLKAVKLLVDNHKSVSISDTNSLCNGLNIRSFGSRHYAGNGSALDIAAVDGVALTGGNAKSITVLKELKPLLLTGSTLHNRSQVGQQNCRSALNLGSVSQIDDSCNHVHIDFPPWSDSSLKYKSGAY